MKISESSIPEPGHDTAGDAGADPGRLPRITDIAVVRITGPEAEAFAQSQFMSDVSGLPVGHWHWSGWLSAKGRVQALFALARPAPGDLLLLLLDQPADAFCAALGRFVLRRRVRVAPAPELAVHAAFDGDAAWAINAEPDALRHGPQGSLGLDCSGDGGSRIGWISAHGGANRSRAELAEDAAATARWRAEDLRHGLPRAKTTGELAFTPHMLSLDRLKAFSVRKGCYPGQEIVARTHFIGQAKRQAWWLEGAALASAQPVHSPDGRVIGEVVAATGEGRGALAVLALETAGPVG
ncbi:MAG TPA: hypothetical protein DCM32_04060, partial [Xanthomonadaceae bacterium]|nr:hypothetical protein [Xanthomonadaceae bacterium]